MCAGARHRLLSFAWKSEFEDLFKFWTSDMKLYLAGNVVNTEGLAPAHRHDYDAGIRNRLVSYAFVDDWAEEAFAFWVRNRPSGVSVFLDSGAFSAMTRKTTIDLDKYCAYIAEHQDALACYAVLDVIGDWRATSVNLDIMEKRGLHPVPCFHRGSPWAELDRLCRDHKHIALGGMVGDGTRGTTNENDLTPHLDACWRVIEKHWPVKVHVFGIVTQWVLERYPFHSADSASAIMGAGMGRVMRWRAGKMRSRGWQEDAREMLDGVVVDGVGRTGGKSQSAHPGRRRRNIEAQLACERYLTDLWAAKGVTWES